MHYTSNAIELISSVLALNHSNYLYLLIVVGIRTSPTPSEASTATATGSDDKQKVSEEENHQSEVEEKGDGNKTPVKEEEEEKEKGDGNETPVKEEEEEKEKGDGNETPVKEEEEEKENPIHPIQATEENNTTESEHTSNSPINVTNCYIQVPEQVEKEDGIIEIVLTSKQVKEEMIMEEEEWVNLSMSDYPHQQSSLHQSTCQLPP